jgi:serine phosphatase RsbU (regulator of sigma subunit)
VLRPGAVLAPHGALGSVVTGGVPFAVRNMAERVAMFPGTEWLMRLAEMDAGVYLPLVAGGRNLGAWAMSWRQEREIDDEEMAVLVTVSGQCAQALARAQLYEGERDTVWTLQHALAPSGVPAVPGLATAVRYLPEAESAVASGDFYDLLRLPDGRVGILLGDVSGHGVTVAATMGLVRTALRAYAAEGHRPSEVVRLANATLVELVPDVLVTCLYGVFDLTTGTLVIVRAGHLPPMIASCTGPVRFLEVPGALPLGVDPEDVPVEQTVVLNSDETVVLFTDGLVEAGHRGLDRGLERLVRAAAQACLEPNPAVRADALVAAMVETLAAEEPEPVRRDDVTVLAFGLAPESAQPASSELMSASPSR